ncbi:hypothetical protein BD410DRAFT_809188 [Rickenella mellea]|uniref:Uncharacterized protein n=1 Tax=Rickenella mellea TaxID=50990 RepID=A0A4Y7PJ69_9AGAM|nr:hypothetical protein BD410DRAFT_809188 [Rickenella mellea]
MTPSRHLPRHGGIPPSRSMPPVQELINPELCRCQKPRRTREPNFSQLLAELITIGHEQYRLVNSGAPGATELLELRYTHMNSISRDELTSDTGQYHIILHCRQPLSSPNYARSIGTSVGSRYLLKRAKREVEVGWQWVEEMIASTECGWFGLADDATEGRNEEVNAKRFENRSRETRTWGLCVDSAFEQLADSEVPFSGVRPSGFRRHTGYYRCGFTPSTIRYPPPYTHVATFWLSRKGITLSSEVITDDFARRQRPGRRSVDITAKSMNQCCMMA